MPSEEMIPATRPSPTLRATTYSMSGPGVTLSARAAVMKSSSVLVSGRLMRLSLRDDFHIAQLALTNRRVVAEDCADEVAPPGVLRVAVAIAIELRPRAIMNRLRALDRLGRLDALAPHPPAADVGMQHFVGPVIVVEVCGQRVARGFSGLLLEPLAGVGRHEALL